MAFTIPWYLEVWKIANHLMYLRCITLAGDVLHTCTHLYNPRFVHFLPPFFTAVCIVKTVSVTENSFTGKEILKFLGGKSTVYNRKWFQIKSGLWWRAYCTSRHGCDTWCNFCKIGQCRLQCSGHLRCPCRQNQMLINLIAYLLFVSFFSSLQQCSFSGR